MPGNPRLYFRFFEDVDARYIGAARRFALLVGHDDTAYHILRTRFRP